MNFGYFLRNHIFCTCFTPFFGWFWKEILNAFQMQNQCKFKHLFNGMLQTILSDVFSVNDFFDFLWFFFAKLSLFWQNLGVRVHIKCCNFLNMLNLYKSSDRSLVNISKNKCSKFQWNLSNSFWEKYFFVHFFLQKCIFE